MKIHYSQQARKELFHAQHYIEQAGYPETAAKYGYRLKAFIESLTIQPKRYAPCRHAQFKKHHFHCAVFEETYIIVYKIFKSSIHIQRVLHGKLIR
jgi:plasmid stabilization system protein ParE